jgi:Flp pilus assembly protein protease CpaA
MNEVIFLFGLGFVWMFFAAVQDLKTTEVSNWLTYSLVVFGLAGRAFFAIAESDLSFFLVGVLVLQSILLSRLALLCAGVWGWRCEAFDGCWRFIALY